MMSRVFTKSSYFGMPRASVADHQRLGVPRLSVLARFESVIGSIGFHDSPGNIVREVNIKDLLDDRRLESLVLYRKKDLDATSEISWHQVGTPEIEFRFTAVVEKIDTCMFQKSADDRSDSYVITQTRNSRPQAADASNL